jgi:hypothetical protein
MVRRQVAGRQRLREAGHQQHVDPGVHLEALLPRPFDQPGQDEGGRLAISSGLPGTSAER